MVEKKIVLEDFIKTLKSKEYLERLDFFVTGWKKRMFPENVHKHTVLSNYLNKILETNGKIVFPMGIDCIVEREYDVIVKDGALDFVFENGSYIIIFDPKSKSSLDDFGRVNLRAIQEAKKIIKYFDYSPYIKIYFIFGLYENDDILKLGYCNVLDRYRLPLFDVIDKNSTYIYDWKDGIPPEFY